MVKRNPLTLNIFDLDDTLFTNEGVKTKVIKDGKVVRELDSQELFSYKLKAGEEYDFSGFRSGKIFYKTAVPIKNLLIKAKTTITSTSKTIIVTARADLSDKHLFLKKFREVNFPIDKVYIERAGNLGTDPSINKPIIISSYLKQGIYNPVRMWDDGASNLDAFLNLQKNFKDIDFEAYIVNAKYGTYRRYK